MPYVIDTLKEVDTVHAPQPQHIDIMVMVAQLADGSQNRILYMHLCKTRGISYNVIFRLYRLLQ